MKTNKFWSIIVMLVFILGMTMSFSSCSKDDDDDKKQQDSIVGTWSWQETEGRYLFLESYTFNADNTFTCVGIEKDTSSKTEGTYNSYGTYIYSAEKNELVLMEEYASEKKGVHFYKILFDKNSFTLIEEDGDKCGPYVKQSK